MCDDHSDFLWKRLNPFSLQVIEPGIPGFADRRTGFNVERGLRPKTNPSTWLPATRLWQVRERTFSVRKPMQKAKSKSFQDLVKWQGVGSDFCPKSNLSILASSRPNVTVTEHTSCKEIFAAWQAGRLDEAVGSLKVNPSYLITIQLDNYYRQLDN